MIINWVSLWLPSLKLGICMLVGHMAVFWWPHRWMDHGPMVDCGDDPGTPGSQRVGTFQLQDLEEPHVDKIISHSRILWIILPPL